MTSFIIAPWNTAVFCKKHWSCYYPPGAREQWLC